MKKKVVLAAILFSLLFGISIGVSGGMAMADTDEDVICNGIYVGPVALGGLTEGQAKEAIDKYVAELKSRKLMINVDGNEVDTVLADLGFRMADNTFVEEALNFGKTGNLIKRYKERKDVEHEQVVYTPEYELDDGKLTELVEEQCGAFDIEPVNAELSRENGQFIITAEKTGRKVSVEDTVEKIKANILQDWDGNDLTIDAVVMDAQPKYTSELLGRCKDVIGEFSTTYTTSSASRANNLANAARLINGAVVYPGEVFSASKQMSPITEANGYSAAGAYLNGKVIDSIGGGVCQVSTTLYNALLKAELEIVERYNHSMIVGYVKPAMDAAISEGYKDLKFKNNTEVPVYIEVYTVGRKITFVLYGEETRDLVNREVRYESEVIDTIQPGKDKITEDPTKPETYEKVEQGAHVGYKANLWKVVYENGKEVSREKVNYSYYAPEPRYVIKGTKKVQAMPKPTKEPKPTKTPKPDSNEDPDEEIVPTKEPEPAATPEPAPTEEPQPDGPADTEPEEAE